LQCQQWRHSAFVRGIRSPRLSACAINSNRYLRSALTPWSASTREVGIALPSTTPRALLAATARLHAIDFG
jgi:hypothetical protein